MNRGERGRARDALFEFEFLRRQDSDRSFFRSTGGGTLLGGCAQPGNWDATVDPNLAVRIMQRAVAVCPALVDNNLCNSTTSFASQSPAPPSTTPPSSTTTPNIARLSIIRHQVGLRPVRAGGVRIARERLAGVWVVHNYGHGGYGYQASYGCAGVAVGLVREVLDGMEEEEEGRRKGTGKGMQGKEGNEKGIGGRARL